MQPDSELKKAITCGRASLNAIYNDTADLAQNYDSSPLATAG
ncbi:MAG: hypothetical protein AAF630_02230 [Cyanobacteria bacterium P01_C01_bin.38]